jgi:hypothetical protein
MISFYQTSQRVERRKSEEERKVNNVTEKETAAFVCEST